MVNVNEDIVLALRKATKDCADRGLIYASKWAAELLLSIPAERRKARPHTEDTSATQMTTEEELKEAELEEDEQDVLSTARAYGEAKEFLRASHLIERNKCQSARARFMSLYYRFLASEKKALRDWHNLDYMLQIPKNSRQPPSPVNKELRDLLVTPLFSVTDPWLLFFNAMLLKRLGRREEAVTQAFLSIKAYPWNWSCWQVVCACIGDSDELYSLITHLPLQQTHPLVQLFTVHVMNQLNTPQESELDICDQLLGDNFFPNSTWIMSLRASVLYHMHDFQKAEKEFDKLIETDPYRIDDIDTLSNILYVAENRVKLSKIAHHYLAIDKDRPEVCVLIGNHYSLRCEREKAIAYFRRATDLDPNCLAAWTLMGHEYVEQKNSHAAIEAYRRAIDANRKDYRAWYGLGQAYELLNMHQYSLHYFQRASALRPYDVRIWQAQGQCYEEMGRLREAIECHKRALLGSDIHETSINAKLGKLYDEVEEYKIAAAYHQRVIDISEVDGRQVANYARSLIYVARYNMERGSEGDLTLAKIYLDRVAASNAEEVGQATDLLRKYPQVLTQAVIESGIAKGLSGNGENGNTGTGTGTGSGNVTSAGNMTSSSTIPLGMIAGASVPSVSLSDASTLRRAYGPSGSGQPSGPPP